MSKICERYAQDIPKFAQGMPTIMYKVSPKYAQDIPMICPRYVKDMPEICPKSEDNIMQYLAKS